MVEKVCNNWSQSLQKTGTKRLIELEVRYEISNIVQWYGEICILK